MTGSRAMRSTLHRISRTFWGFCAGPLAAGVALVGCKDEQRRPNGDQPAAVVTEHVEEKPLSFPTAPLTEGATVFDFSALAQNGQSLKLSDYSKRPVVVYFCPQDAQQVCTTLATSVRDAWAELHAQLDMVYGVSPEPTIIHREFTAEHSLSHLLLTDPEHTLHRIFGIQPGVVVAYLIGTDRQILHTFSPLNPATFGADVLSVIQAKGLKLPDYPI